jgi:RNA polymerase subunit RPABC4/transcription elongation factor Spt4
VAADLLPAIAELRGAIAEGPRWQIVISPGVLRVRTRDYARAERGHERRLRQHQADIDTHVRLRPKEAAMTREQMIRTRGRIRGWSARSRAHLVARLSDLDYTRLYGRYKSCTGCGADYSVELDRCPTCRSTDSALTDRTGRLPCMLTLTYPGDWVAVAPDGETVKRHLAALASRYKRAWGEPLIGVWKLEFQRRGAPHFHLSTTPPMGFTRVRDPHTGEAVDFRRWLSIVWADIVAHPDPEQWRRHLAAGTGVDYAEGIRCSDPRRMAVYFAKYGHGGAKDYQHQVPPQWLSARLRCQDCDTVYVENGDDPCPACGSYEAELIEEAGGTGRIWGYWGLRPVFAVREVTPQVGIQAGRVMRRWYRAKRLTKKITVQRVERATGRVYIRHTTVRKKLFTHNRGFAIVNDGPAFASLLAHYLTQLADPGRDPGRRSPDLVHRLPAHSRAHPAIEAIPSD